MMLSSNFCDVRVRVSIVSYFLIKIF